METIADYRARILSYVEGKDPLEVQTKTPELRRQLCDGVIHALIHQRVVGIASHYADLTRVADVHLHALAVDFASTLGHRQHLARVGADQTCADLHLGTDVV